MRIVTLKAPGSYEYGQPYNVLLSVRRIITLHRGFLAISAAALYWWIMSSDSGPPAIQNVIYLITNI